MEIETQTLASDESRYALNIAGVYEDNVTRDWAMRSCRTERQRVGEEHVQETWYHVNSLSDRKILRDAVQAAVVADVIVVSVHAAGDLPLELYVWIDVWLPRRLSRAGTLAALIGVAEPADPDSVRTHEYLRAVARKGQLDYIPQERKRPAASRVSPMGMPALALRQPTPSCQAHQARPAPGRSHSVPLLCARAESLAAMPPGRSIWSSA